MNRQTHKQRGAVLVETALTMTIFMLLVLAIFELALLISEWARSVEATRRLARHLVVNTAPVDLSGMDCNAGTSIHFTCASADCGEAWQSASRLVPNMAAGSMHVTYQCSSASYPGRPEEMPVYSITVEVRDHTSVLAIPALVGLPLQISMPGFSTTRITEDMHTPGG